MVCIIYIPIVPIGIYHRMKFSYSGFNCEDQASLRKILNCVQFFRTMSMQCQHCFPSISTRFSFDQFAIGSLAVFFNEDFVLI